jgi:hypothetical protein
MIPPLKRDTREEASDTTCGCRARGLPRFHPRPGPTRWRFVRNEPNFAPPQAADGGNCSKRSQTWGDWSIWAKAFVVWCVARPGSEMCKTNPLGGPEAPGLRIGRRRLRAGTEGQMCKTNPIWGRIARNEPNWPGGRVGAQNRPNSAPAGRRMEESAQNKANSGMATRVLTAAIARG